MAMHLFAFSVVTLTTHRDASSFSSLRYRQGVLRQRSVSKPRYRRNTFRATLDSSSLPSSSAGAGAGAPTPDQRTILTVVQKTKRQLVTLWQFSRPHTVIGTLLAIVSLHALAWKTSWAGLSVAVSRLIVACIPALAMNVFIVGLNQVHDVSIDRINKPKLPIPSGRLSVPDARRVLYMALLIGLSFCVIPGIGVDNALRSVLLGSALLGAMYSAPPFRLKRWPVLASACILAVRGFLINTCFFWHAVGSASGTTSLPPLLAFAVVFFVFYGIIIALMKDVPDIEGDRIFGIRTFSVRIGPRAVFQGCVGVLMSMFLAAFIAYWYWGSGSLFARFAALAQLALALVLGFNARKVDETDKRETYSYYMLTWVAFYLEYIFLPLAL